MQLSLSQEHAASTDVAYNLLDCMNRLPAYSSLHYTLHPPLISWICMLALDGAASFGHYPANTSV